MSQNKSPTQLSELFIKTVSHHVLTYIIQEDPELSLALQPYFLMQQSLTVGPAVSPQR